MRDSAMASLLVRRNWRPAFQWRSGLRLEVRTARISVGRVRVGSIFEEIFGAGDRLCQVFEAYGMGLLGPPLMVE